jgi:hypothetical protein
MNILKIASRRDLMTIIHVHKKKVLKLSKNKKVN